MLGILLSALDQTVVGVAMPQIITSLNGLEHYAWVATAYLLASTASMPIWGKLSDAYGRKRFYLVGMVVFVLGSALSGQSHTMTELILFRALQGVGAGAIMPIAQAIIGDVFPPAQRARWTGLIMAVWGLAVIVGPLIGGWFTDSSLGWRWAFYVNVPVGIVAIAFAAVALPAHVSLRQRRIDYVGSALLVAATVPLLLGLSWGGGPYAWLSWQIVTLFALSAVMWVTFFAKEWRTPEPVFNPRLFRNDIFTASAVAAALQSAAMFGAAMFLPLYVQGVLGESATSSGIVLMPAMLGAIVTSIGAGQLLSRTGRYKAVLITGFAFTTVGMLLLSRMGVDAGEGAVTRVMVILGLGLGVGVGSFTVIVQNQFPSSRFGEVTAGIQFFRSIGSTVGLAVLGTVLTNRFTAAMAENLPGPVERYEGAAALDDPRVLLSPQASERIHDLLATYGAKHEQLLAGFTRAVRQSLDAAMSSVFLIGALVSVAGLVAVLVLREDPLRRTHLTLEQEEMLLADAGAEVAGGLTPEGSAAEGGLEPPASCGYGGVTAEDRASGES